MFARRSVGKSTPRKRIRPSVETLEERTAPAVAVATPLVSRASPHDFTAAGNGYTPAQIRTAYGINGIAFGNIAGDGTGQTIAIVDAFSNPNLYGDVDAFSQQFTLTGSGPTIYQQYGPASSFLTVVNQNGGSILPGTDPTGGWEEEEALDVEWAHAIAPGAKIVLVVANSDTVMNDLFTAVRTAAAYPGVSVVSMSWGFNEFVSEASFDSAFTTPAGHQGVTFVAATGDNGVSSYPPYSPNVVAVGGTTLTLGPNGEYWGETGWGSGVLTSRSGGTGGGTSLYEPEPSYQFGVQSTGVRTNPDVSFVADPNTGVPLYDSFNAGATGPWSQEGGTSLGTPVWAALIAITNQGRTLGGIPTLDGRSQTLPALYSLPSSDFHDITTGSIGLYSATAGYDLVTGLGTPVANLIVRDLGNYGVQDHLIVTTPPPASVVAGTPFSIQIAVDRPNGQLDTAFYGLVTLSLANNPGGSTLGGNVSVQAIAGVATFSGLTLNNPASGYVIRASSNGMTVTTGGFAVTSAPATRLAVTAQPPATVSAGGGFSLTVTVLTASGAVASSFNGVVKLSLASNPGGATLGGPIAVAAVNGVAVFNGLTLNQAGAGYAIRASSGGLTAATTGAINIVAAASVPSAPQLSAASDTGVSATDGYTRNNGSATAPLTFIVNGVGPADGFVTLYDVTVAGAPVLLGGAQAVSGVATITVGGTPLASGAHLIAATMSATAGGAPSALSPATTIHVNTSLQVTSITPSANFLTSLAGNQVVVVFNDWLTGLTPDLSNGKGLASQPFAVMLIPSGPDGPAIQAQTGGLWAAPSGIDGGNLPVPATLVYHENANGTSTITLTPNQPLSADIYLIAIAGLSDLAGNSLNGPIYSSFAYHAATSTSPLQIATVSTANGAITISNNVIPQPDTIAIQFNKALDTRTVNGSSVHLYAKVPGGGVLVAAAVAYSPTLNTIYLTPEAILTPGTVYYIAVDPSVRDASAFPSQGASLGYTFATSFTVAQNGVGAGHSPLTVTATNPGNGSQWTSSLGYGAVTFSETINLQSLGRFSAMLIPQTGGATTGTSGYADVPLNAKVAFNPNTNQLIIVPTGLLPDNTIFLFALSGITATNGDVLGNTPVYSTFLWHNLTTAVPHTAQADPTPTAIAAVPAVTTDGAVTKVERAVQKPVVRAPARFPGRRLAVAQGERTRPAITT